MRFVRTFGISAVVAVAAMALVGATSASAAPTTLCLLNEDPCAAKNIYHEPLFGFVGETSKAKTEATFVFPLVTASCHSSKFRVTHSEASGEPLVGSIPAPPFTNCSECNFASENNPYGATIEATGKGNGIFTFSGLRIKATCSFGFCYYEDPKSITATIEGGEPLTFKLTSVLNKLPESWLSCPSTMEFRGVYQQAFIERLYITHT